MYVKTYQRIVKLTIQFQRFICAFLRRHRNSIFNVPRLFNVPRQYF